MKKAFTLVVFLHSIALLSQSTYYVNQNVQGGLQNGLSWADAFSDLQQALSTSNEGDEIWVAKGTYLPTNTSDRSIYFVLKQGVKIYGGFIGTESVLAERIFEINQTILSGNIGGPQGADNSYHVLYGTGLDSTTIVDGFTISKGVANGNDFPTSTKWGGGLLLEPSTDRYNTCPIIQNCRFEDNYALIGGAVHCPWELEDNYVNPIIRNCQFVSNRAQQSGGGLFKGGPSVPDLPFIMGSCTFSKNSALIGNGGALYLTNTENKTIIRNCLFEKDTSKFSWGGAIFIDHMRESYLQIEGCDFKENYATEGAAICADYEFGSNVLFSIDAFSCNFEKNKASNGLGGAILFFGKSESRISARLFNSNFSYNQSASYATAISIGGKEISLAISHCLFRDNVGVPPNPNGSRYAIFLGGLLTETKFTNCIFSNNESALGFFSPENAKATHRITNCTFFQNGKYVIDKTNFPFGTGYNNCYIMNSIIEDDATFDRMFSDNSLTSANMDGYFIDYSFVSLDDNVTPPHPFGPNTVFKATPFFVDTANNDFRLQKCSPAVNAGNNVIVDTLGILTDLNGNPRIRFDTVDIGAYESQEPCFTSSSSALPTTSVSATLSPNPASPGSKLKVQVFGLEHSKIEWLIWDSYGRAIATAFLINEDGLSLEAPRLPGVYFLEIRAGAASIWWKVLVR